MSNGFSDAFGSVVDGMIIVLCISVPLGIWKLIDIIIWLIKHFRVTIQ